MHLITLTNSMRKTALIAATVGLLGAAAASAAVIYTEDFTGSAPGTYNGRDGVFGTVGYSGADSFEGSFDAQGSPSPETDAIRITDSNFLYDYASAYPAYNTFWWTFDFYADDVAPSDFNVIMGNGSDTFIYTGTLNPVTGLNSLTVQLDSSYWIGGPGSYSSFDLSGMSYIDIQYSRNGTGAQQYYFDNFTLNGNFTEGGGGGGDSAVPEPNTLFITGIAGTILFSLRRRLTAMKA